MSELLDRLEAGVILADGAMGTMLHSRGVSFDKCFDELNLTNPAAVAQLHHEYVDSGAQLILSNTFGANRFKLGKHGLESQVREINRAGVELARRAAQAAASLVLVAGDLGQPRRGERRHEVIIRPPGRPCQGQSALPPGDREVRSPALRFSSES